METIRNVHSFVNSHWEFSFALLLLSDWLFYRMGFKQGRQTPATTERDV